MKKAINNIVWTIVFSSILIALFNIADVRAATKTELTISACEGKGAAWGDGFCDGIVFTMSRMNHVFENEDRWCPPENVSNGQIRAVYKQYVKSRPKTWNSDPLLLYMLAMQDAWPCR